MIKLEHVVLASPEQMEFIIEGMRNPMNSWDKSDSGSGCYITEDDSVVNKEKIQLDLQQQDVKLVHGVILYVMENQKEEVIFQDQTITP